MPRWMSWIGYTVFGLMMLALFIYLNFPYQRLKAVIAASFQRHVPAQLSIETLEANPPLGIAGRNVVISAVLNNETIELLKADKIVLQFLPHLWIQGGSPMRFEVHAYGGTISTLINIHQVLNPVDKPLEIVFQGIDLGRHAALRAAVAQEIAGRLEGELKVHPRPGGLWKSQLGGHLTASDVIVNGIRNIAVNPGRLTFSKIECVLAVSDGILHLAPLRARGREAEGALEGTLSLQAQFRASTLNMRGRVLIRPALAQKLGPILDMVRKSRTAAGEIPFVLTGTLDRPNLVAAGIKL